MGNTEIFEFYETSSNRQCPDCALYWEVGIVYYTCMQPAEQNRHMNKDRFDVLSILGYVTKKDQSRGVSSRAINASDHVLQSMRYGQESQNPKIMVSAKLFLKDGIRMNNIARICLNMDGQEKKSNNMTHLHWKIILSSLHLKNEARYAKSWHISLNKERNQGPIRQRPDFREAKHTYLQLYKEHVESTGERNSPIHLVHQAGHHHSHFSRFRGVQLHSSSSNWQNLHHSAKCASQCLSRAGRTHHSVWMSCFRISILVCTSIAQTVRERDHVCDGPR